MTSHTVTPPFFRFQLPALIWALTIFIASSIPQHSIPDFALFSQDKLLHLLVYFILTGLLHVALFHQTRFPALARRPMHWSVLIACIYGVTDEAHQSLVGRSADILDLVADIAGAILFAATVRVVMALRRVQAR